MRARNITLKGVQFPAALDAALEMKEKKPEAAPTAEQESSLRERALLVRFSIGRWYGSGADEEVIAELRSAKNATGEIGCFTKRLMKREHLAEINKITAESRRYHKTMTLPWGEGTSRILNVEVFREYKERMTRFEADFNKAVDRFIAKYPLLVEAERGPQGLGDLWKASDYPSPEEMRSSFRFGLNVDVLPAVHDLRLHLSKEQAAEIRKEVEQRMHQSLIDAVGDIYERLREEISDAKAKLDDPDKNLQGRMFNTLQGIIGLLPKLNIAADPRLTALGREIQKELVSAPVETMREDATIRKATSDKAAKLLASIAALKGQLK